MSAVMKLQACLSSYPKASPGTEAAGSGRVAEIACYRGGKAMLRAVPTAVPLRAHVPVLMLPAHTKMYKVGRVLLSAPSKLILTVGLASQTRRLHTSRSRQSARIALHGVQTGEVRIQEFLSGKLGKANAKSALDEDAQIVAVECSLDGQGQRLLCTTSKQNTFTFEIPCTGAPQDQPVKRVEASAGKQISHLTFKDWKLESAKVCELEVSLQEATSLVSEIEERVQGKISELKSEAEQEDDTSSGREDELRDLQLRMQKAQHCLTEGLQERAVEARLLLLAFLGSESLF